MRSDIPSGTWLKSLLQDTCMVAPIIKQNNNTPPKKNQNKKQTKQNKQKQNKTTTKKIKNKTKRENIWYIGTAN